MVEEGGGGVCVAADRDDMGDEVLRGLWMRDVMLLLCCRPEEEIERERVSWL